MQITATVNVINKEESGTSRANGNAWRSQSLVLHWVKPLDEGRERDQYLQVTLHGESIDKFAGLNAVEGQTQITGELDFQTRCFNGKVYNEISLYL